MSVNSKSATATRGLPIGPLIAALFAIAVAFAAAAIVVPRPAHAAVISEMELSADQLKTVKRMDLFLKTLTTMQARFLQVSSSGEFAEGSFFLSKPGLTRVEYDPPVPVLIVADGTWLIYKDTELDQVSHMLLSTSPAGILVNNDLALISEEIMITDFERNKGVVRITVARRSDPMEGSLTLTFSEKPVALRKWTVIDAQGTVTAISLSAMQTGVKLSSDLFKVKTRNPFKSEAY